MVGRVEGVGCEDEVKGLRRVGFGSGIISVTVVTVTVIDVIVILVSKEGTGIEIRPIERGGRDGAARGQVCVIGDIAGQVWEDVGEVCEVGCGLEEGGSGDADEARAGAEFEDAGTCGCRIGIGIRVRILWVGKGWGWG